ncbi:MAG: carboxypeptidase-like regulatory domain-containing protein [Lewinellaceae bacterium]|nr:carboxypeptidase-like regulatory domain-containing protein [Lewinellaceae bacterium]
MKKIPLILAFFSLLSMLSAQTGTVKGTVLDQQSEMPVIGATVQLVGAETPVGAITDIDGYFVLEKVPAGRNVLQVQYVGYEMLTLPNVEVSTGKDVILNIAIQEKVSQLNEVVVVAKTIKDRPQNDMAAVSARQFSVEEVNRFSGGRSDVARLASNFAGVSAPDDSRNDIVIRGNSPTGVLWRIEGIPVPNPNHFSTFGTTGSPVSALNPNVLRNSDFLTSAFPAEYGNANAGVFDIGFRSGNRDRHEFTLQAGAFSGLEGMAEGPLGNNGGSYLVAGRYSLIGLIGAGSTAATPNYQDLSFKVDLGRTKAGKFSIFGIGGRSDITFLGSEIEEGDLFAAEDEDGYVDSRFGVLGLSHNLIVGENSYIRTVLGGSFQGNNFEQDRYYNLHSAEATRLRITEVDNAESRFTLSTYFNSKINARLAVRTGLLYENLGNNSIFRDREDAPDRDGDGEADWFTVYDIDGRFSLVQPFAQAKYRLAEKIEINAGLHGQYSTLNEQLALEPRASASYAFNSKHRVTLGYGMHSQMAPLPILFLNEEVDGELVRANESLDFVRSQHYVLGYDTRLSQDWRLKTEVYYQDISRAPVEMAPTSYSTLTEGADFAFSDDKTSLVSEGTGFNRGVELTLEKFYSKGYYTLLTTSLFESKYEGSDGIERNTPFNNGYVLNLLAGKEFKIGKGGKNAIVFDTKLTTAGGRWYTPVNLEASRNAGFEVLQTELAFSEQYDSYFRWDVKLGLKLNSSRKKVFHQFFIDLQNVTNQQNIFARQYNRLTNNIDQVNQIGFFPDFLYRVQF